MRSGALKQQSFDDHRRRSGRGGPRPGAGRKPSGGICERRKRRERFSGCKPVHVTLRMREGLPRLRSRRLVGELRRSFGEARLSRAVQKVFRVTGRVLAQRYHAYVLLNARKHWRERRGDAPSVRLDEASSSRWFDGFTRELPGARAGPREVAGPRTWLLARGWRRNGLIDPASIPGAR